MDKFIDNNEKESIFILRLNPFLHFISNNKSSVAFGTGYLGSFYINPSINWKCYLNPAIPGKFFFSPAIRGCFILFYHYMEVYFRSCNAWQVLL
jgi:hypothetical protein